MYGWDGDTLALESSVRQGYAAGERTVHYVYERDSFVPLLQATRKLALRLAPTTDVKALTTGNGGKYDIALDPLWNGEYEQDAEPFNKEEIAFYQCDHLGTPQELTDCESNVAWSAQYKAWGQAKEAISEAAYKAGIRNPIRFQGQYLDDETGLHYNRHRYYDPYSGQFISDDPIGLLGGINTRAYAPNPIQWADPLGLSSTRLKTTGTRAKCPKCNPCAGKNPAAIARSWQGPSNAPYVGVDSYTNTVLKKGTVLYTLYPYGPRPGNYFAGSPTMLKAGTAQGYNDSVQVAHAGNTSGMLPMRTRVQAFVVKEDICVAKGTAHVNPHLGTGGGTQYFIENGDKPKLTSGPIVKFSK